MVSLQRKGCKKVSKNLSYVFLSGLLFSKMVSCVGPLITNWSSVDYKGDKPIMIRLVCFSAASFILLGIFFIHLFFGLTAIFVWKYSLPRSCHCQSDVELNEDDKVVETNWVDSTNLQLTKIK